MTTTLTRHGSWILLRRTLCGSALAALLLAPAARAQASRWDVQLQDLIRNRSFHLDSFTGEYEYRYEDRSAATGDVVTRIIGGVGTVERDSFGFLIFRGKVQDAFGTPIELFTVISQAGTGLVTDLVRGVDLILDLTPGSVALEPSGYGLNPSAAGEPRILALGTPIDITDKIDSFVLEGSSFIDLAAEIRSLDGSYSWDYFQFNLDTGEVQKEQIAPGFHFDLGSLLNWAPGGPFAAIELGENNELTGKVKVVGEEGSILDELEVGKNPLSQVLHLDPKNPKRGVATTQDAKDPKWRPRGEEIFLGAGGGLMRGATLPYNTNIKNESFDTGPGGEVHPAGTGTSYFVAGEDEDGEGRLWFFRNWLNPSEQWQSLPLGGRVDFFNTGCACENPRREAYGPTLFGSWKEDLEDGRRLAIRGFFTKKPPVEVEIDVTRVADGYNGLGCVFLPRDYAYFGFPGNGSFSITGLNTRDYGLTQYSIPLPTAAGSPAALGVTPGGESLAVVTTIEQQLNGQNLSDRRASEPAPDPRQEAVVPALGLVLIPLGPPPAPAGEWLASPDLPGYQVKVQISAGQQRFVGRLEADCLPETLCISGAVPGRPEVFTRVVGPKPNGNLWPNVVKFSTSRVEVWIHQIATGTLAYYDLPPVAPGTQRLALAGLADKVGFLPPWSGEPVGGASAGTGRSGEVAPARSRDGRANPLAGAAGAGRASGDPAPPAGPWLTSAELLGFRAKVRITAGAQSIQGSSETDCIGETLCVSGAVAGRSEAFLRVVGPKPNGKLWPTIVKFSTSQLEVWLEQTASGEVRYYRLDAVAPGSTTLVLDGLADKLGFDP